jgi:hypothetical protein
MIASGSVQKPSFAITGEVLLTVIVAVGASGLVGPAKVIARFGDLIFRSKAREVPACAKSASKTPIEQRLSANKMRGLKRPDVEVGSFRMMISHLLVGQVWI